jgi:hypothetical protein
MVPIAAQLRDGMTSVTPMITAASSIAVPTHPAVTAREAMRYRVQRAAAASRRSRR